MDEFCGTISARCRPSGSDGDLANLCRSGFPQWLPDGTTSTNRQHMVRPNKNFFFAVPESGISFSANEVVGLKCLAMNFGNAVSADVVCRFD